MPEAIQFARAILAADCAPVLLKYAAKLEKANNWFDAFAGRGGSDDDDGHNIVAACCAYAKEFGRTPNAKELKDYVATRYEPGRHGFDSQRIEKELELCAGYDELNRSVRSVEPELSEYLRRARVLMLEYRCNKAIRCAYGDIAYPANKGGERTRKATIEDAKQELRKVLASDLTETDPEPAGLLHENVEAIALALDKAGKVEESGRLFTGWSHIDEKFAIGLNSNRCIGIMAYPNHGKSTTVLTLAYNFWQQGANIVFVSLEHSPTDMWQKFAYLVTDKYRDHFTLPPLLHWYLEPQSITRQVTENFATVLRDIQDRKPIDNGDKPWLHGTIDFQQMRTWDETVAYVEGANAKNPIHALFIDYIADLETPDADPRFRDKAVDELFRKAHTLSQSFNGGKGLIVVSPLQVKKAAFETAAKMKVENGVLPKRYDENAVSQYSAAIQRMDVLIYVYMSDDRSDQLEMGVPKVRHGLRIGPRAMTIDSVTREVYEVTTRPKAMARMAAAASGSVFEFDLQDVL